MKTLKVTSRKDGMELNMVEKKRLVLELMKLDSWVEKSRTNPNKLIQRATKDYPAHILEELEKDGKITMHPKSKFVVITEETVVSEKAIPKQIFLLAYQDKMGGGPYHIKETSDKAMTDWYGLEDPRA